MRVRRLAVLLLLALGSLAALLLIVATLPGGQPVASVPTATATAQAAEAVSPAPPAPATSAVVEAPSRTASGGAFATGVYRNLFAERTHSPDAIATKITAAWTQFFAGDANTQRVYYEAGRNAAGPLAYILDVGNNDVRTEGMSYGMMIAVQLDHQTEFNALWNWARTYMYHTDGDLAGYFAWHCATSGAQLDANPATDGEEWFAMALYFAAGRWGNGAGIYDYKAQAEALTTTMLHHAAVNGVTPMIDGTAQAPVFVPYGQAATFTDPSYHLPAYYELFARFGPRADADIWRAVAARSRTFFGQTLHSTTGLAPDYANFDGSARNEGGHGDFRFDAWRVASNIAVDHAWFAADSQEPVYADRIQAFFAGQGMASYANQYTLAGQALSGDHSPGLVAMNGVASLAATYARAGQFVDAVWNLPIPSGQWRYYDGMLYMLSLLHLSGNFRIYTPGRD